MRRRALTTEATNLVDNRSTGVRQTVRIQVLGPGTVYISTQQNDLQQLDITSAPVNGLRLTQLSSIADGTFFDFLGQLWVRADQGVDIEVNLTNSPPQMNIAVENKRPSIPYNAPIWGKF